MLLFISYLLQVTVGCRTVDGVLAFLIRLCCTNLFTTGQHNVRYLGSFPAYLTRHGCPRANGVPRSALTLERLMSVMQSGLTGLHPLGCFVH